MKAVADMVVTNGLKAVGYEYINLDDGWAGYRDSNGVMVANSKFPHGMKYLADYIHSKGLKIGLYTVFGPTTCAGFPGSMGYELLDAQTYASWGIDYVKYEGCSFPNPLSVQEEKCFQMRDALMATGRPIVFTMSTGPVLSWFPDAMNSWRYTGDNDVNWESVLYHIDIVAQTPGMAGPGHWNDADVLNIGRGWSTKTEDKAMFSMYCMLTSPLLTATPFPSQLDVLTNAEAIAIDQDVAGIQGICVRTNGELQVWCKPLGSANSNVKAVALFNRGTNAANITATWSDLGFSNGLVSVRDLWSKVDEGNFQTNYTANVPGHGVKLMKMILQPPPPPGTNYLSDLNWVFVSATNNIHLDKDALNHTLRMRSISYSKGIGMVPTSSVQYLLGGVVSRFHARIGVDDDAGTGGSVVFQLFADGTKIYDSGTMTALMSPKDIDIDLTGKQKCMLLVADAGDGAVNDYADWANASFVLPAKANFGVSRVNASSVVFSGAGGIKNASYYVLCSTNVTLPVAQWKGVQTNHFDANGNFSFTNGVGANSPKLFYRLQVP